MSSSFDISKLDFRPTSTGIFKMLAHSQYTFFFALLELLDNAISKGSTYSRIRLWQSSKKFLEALCIIDDG